MSPHCGTGVSLDLLNDSHLSSAQGLHLVNLRIVAFSDSLQKFIVSLRTGDHRFLYHFLKDEAFFFFFFLHLLGLPLSRPHRLQWINEIKIIILSSLQPQPLSSLINYMLKNKLLKLSFLFHLAILALLLIKKLF